MTDSADASADYASSAVKRTAKLTRADQRQLKHELATGDIRRTDLAKKYDVTSGYITNFAKQYKRDIDDIKANLNDEFAGLWIAQQEQRIAAYEAEYARAEDHKLADHHEWIKARTAILQERRRGTRADTRQAAYCGRCRAARYRRHRRRRPKVVDVSAYTNAMQGRIAPANSPIPIWSIMLFIPLGRRAKYQGKIAKMEYKDAKHGRKAAKAAANRAQWAALTPQQRKIRLITIGVIALVLFILMLIGGH